MKKLLLALIIALMLLSCAKEKDKNRIIKIDDSLNGNYNTPALTIKKLRAAGNNSSKPKFGPEVLYGIWTLNNNGPHADFKITKEAFYIADSEDDGNHTYTISNDTITVRYKDYNAVGIIKKAVKDTLIINWDNSADVLYVIWKG